MTARKQQIKQAFSKASGTYDDAAGVQLDYAQRLADLVAKGPLAESPKILEIGCGTGALTRALRAQFDDADIFATDISETMIAAAKDQLNDPDVRYGIVDGEQPDPTLGSYDLIVSNLTIQWFTDLAGSLNRLAALLNPGGRMVLSTLGAKSFREWRIAHDALDLNCGIPDFPEAAVVSQLLPQCGGGVVSEIESEIPFETAITFAQSLKLTGAHVPVRDYKPLSPAAFRALGKELGSPFTMTYHVLMVDFVKGTETQS